MFKTPPVKCPQFLLDAARGGGKTRSAIVNAGKPVVMEAVREAVLEGLIEPLLFGDQSRIRACARDLDWPLDGVEVIDAASDREAARLAACAVRDGRAGLIAKGHIHTDDFLRAILARDACLLTGKRLTHVFCMTFPNADKPLLITDAAVNVEPDFETQKAIVENAVNLARAIGVNRPNVAMLSATEEASSAIPSSMAAKTLCVWAASAIPGADFAGPLAFDLCVSPRAVKIKNVTGPVPGNADIVVVPDITTGNALFKAMVYMTGACAAGVVLGAKVPAVLTSRADPPAARLASFALATLASRP